MSGIANLTVLALASRALRSGGAVLTSGEAFGIGALVDNVHLAAAPEKNRARGEIVIQACRPGAAVLPADGLKGPGRPRNGRSSWRSPVMFEDPLRDWLDWFDRTPLPRGRDRQAKGGSPIRWAARGAGGMDPCLRLLPGRPVSRASAASGAGVPHQRDGRCSDER
jgi:hypothetical protein